MKKSKWEKKPWAPKKITYVPTDEALTPSAGLGALVDLFVESPLFEKFRACLPVRKSNASFDSAHFACTFLSGFWYGHDSLDDMEEFENDPSVEEKLGELPSARAAGDFLRDFSEENRTALNSFLVAQALAGRKQIKPEEPITLDIDSTAHVQSGDKMEGLAFNYKNQWCLDSQVIFDELGLSYGMELRSGNTFSSEGSAEMIERVLKKLPQLSKGRKHSVRADSAYCREDFIRMCLLNNTYFTITAHDNINWTEMVDKITDWEPHVYTAEELKSAEKRKRKLPKIELGHFLYQPGWSENLRFPVIIKRTWIEGEEGTLLDMGYWKYYAVMTNRAQHKKQEIMEHHQKRGNSENFIREEKYGYDLKHFPCQKLNANHAYGLLATVAHNFLRTIALIDKPDRPHYSKKLRRKFVYIPGRFVKHARSLVMKIPKRYYEEVTRLQQAWANSFQLALAPGS